MQLDEFWVAEWGTLSGGDIPTWISFQNTTIDTGVMFKIQPTESELVGKKFGFYFVLDDGKDSSKCEFSIEVIEPSNITQTINDLETTVEQIITNSKS